ncbi:MAG: GNAT family N-acetyltransferase [Proteobacteria bacterium]|nr:GNAT family N-acetyltransferase [Pseudomonadota bacterium]
MSDVTLRDLHGMAEFLAAERLQRAVWGQDDSPDPADLMMVVQAEGGLCAGAFRGGDLIGYVFGFPTRDPGVQHSHRLAVASEARGLKLGVRLKWYQRDWCLRHGVGLVRWTFDPLRRTNATLNIDTLGASGNVYHTDYYGDMAGINAGAPSDRLSVEWRLDALGVKARAEGQRPRPGAGGIKARVNIPADFAALLSGASEVALSERLRVRDSLQAAFADGLEIGGFDRETGDYLLVKRGAAT